MKIKFNKRGDVPVMILVLGVFLICAIALLSFYFVNFKALKNFQGYLAVEEANSLAEEYTFYKSIGLNQEISEKAIGIENCDEGKCIQVIRIASGKEIKVIYPLKFWNKNLFKLE
ncbi:MAG: hypothetical protein AABW50_03540 [Nanoarchaeota archaeon]